MTFWLLAHGFNRGIYEIIAKKMTAQSAANNIFYNAYLEVNPLKPHRYLYRQQLRIFIRSNIKNIRFAYSNRISLI